MEKKTPKKRKKSQISRAFLPSSTVSIISAWLFFVCYFVCFGEKSSTFVGLSREKGSLNSDLKARKHIANALAGSQAVVSNNYQMYFSE